MNIRDCDILQNDLKYDQEITESHTADQPTALRGRAKEH